MAFPVGITDTENLVVVQKLCHSQICRSGNIILYYYIMLFQFIFFQFMIFTVAIDSFTCLQFWSVMNNPINYFSQWKERDIP